MVEAFDREHQILPACRGRHPQLNRFETDCSQTLRPILLGASNGWFPVAMTVLSVPTQRGRLEQLVEDHWVILEHATSLEILRAFRGAGQLTAFSDFADDALWGALENYRNRDVETQSDADLKTPEWEVFADPELAPQGEDFRITPIAAPNGIHGLSGVLLAERLREVGALIGFTRVEPPDEGSANDGPIRAPITSAPPGWILAAEVRGEGVFLRLDEGVLAEWLVRPEVRARERTLLDGYRRWRLARRLPADDAGFPGALQIAIHSLSHALLREFAIECGYGAASIRERVYGVAEDGVVRQAGLMLYTAAPDSEGTLGGLVQLGRPENLGRLLRRALEGASLCSSDPLCAEHDPTGDRSLHGAACHACLFAAETSCEQGNRFLDRALIVPTLASEPAAALFDTWT
jgi:hypothetical protein